MAKTFSTLISVAELQALLPDVLLIDVGFDLADPAAGERAYAAGHLPGAHYLHLDRDLSAAKTGLNGRHPLPPRELFAQRMASLGLRAGTQVVAYDAQGGMYAARLDTPAAPASRRLGTLDCQTTYIALAGGTGVLLSTVGSRILASLRRRAEWRLVVASNQPGARPRPLT